MGVEGKTNKRRHRRNWHLSPNETGKGHQPEAAGRRQDGIPQGGSSTLGTRGKPGSHAARKFNFPARLLQATPDPQFRFGHRQVSATQAGYEAYLEYLGSLRSSGASYFLEGGQAVNFWAEYVDSRVQGQPLSPLRPFTSKDCDIWVNSDTWEKLKRDPQLRQGSSPADGQLGILTLSEDPPRVVDVLSSVYGSLARCPAGPVCCRQRPPATGL